MFFMKVELVKVSIAHSSHITNTYIVYGKDKEGIVIDPGDEASRIIKRISELDINIKYIVITHAHADHIGALDDIIKYTKAQVIIHKADKEALLNNAENYCQMLNVKPQHVKVNDLIEVDDNYLFNVDDLSFEVIHTPGHTAGSICLYEKNLNVLFTGDTIFYDCYGRCDLYSGDFSNMVNSVRKLFNRFSDITIYPGHDKIVNIDSAKKRIRLLFALKEVNL